jgi:hypothetical protein
VGIGNWVRALLDFVHKNFMRDWELGIGIYAKVFAQQKLLRSFDFFAVPLQRSIFTKVD